MIHWYLQSHSEVIIIKNNPNATPPTWEEAKEAVIHNRSTPIDELIYYFQPPTADVAEMSRQELFRGIVGDILYQINGGVDSFLRNCENDNRVLCSLDVYAIIPVEELALLKASRHEQEGSWQKSGREWSEYPIGTKARQSWDYGYWVKTEHGWQWPNGGTFPRPAAADQVMLPAVSSQEDKPADKLRKAAENMIRQWRSSQDVYGAIQQLQSALEEE
jgi:hypothetical protein